MIKTHEIKYKYKNTKTPKRIALVIFLSTTITYLIHLPEYRSNKERSNELMNQLKFEQTAYNSARKKSIKIRMYQDKLINLEEKAKEAKKIIPESFKIEKILNEISKKASKNNIEISIFNPLKAKVSGTKFKYVEMPIEIETKGSFNDTMIFLDSVMHLEMLISMNVIELTNRVRKNKQEPSKAEQRNLLPIEDYDKKIRSLYIVSNFKISIFRSLKKEEVSQLTELKKKPNAKK